MVNANKKAIDKRFTYEDNGLVVSNDNAIDKRYTYERYIFKKPELPTD